MFNIKFRISLTPCDLFQACTFSNSLDIFNMRRKSTMTMTVLDVQECSFTTKLSFPLLANGKNRLKFSSKTTMVCEICDRFITGWFTSWYRSLRARDWNIVRRRFDTFIIHYMLPILGQNYFHPTYSVTLKERDQVFFNNECEASIWADAEHPMKLIGYYASY